MNTHEYLRGFNTTPLTNEERVQLVTLARTTSSKSVRDAAMARIIGDCIKVVLSIAMNYRLTEVSVTDLVQQGVLELQKIVLGSNYDPTRVRLMSYAWRAVNGVMAEYVMNNRPDGTPYKLNHKTQSHLTRVCGALAALNCLNGEWPTPSQILARIKQADDKVSQEMAEFQVERCLKILRDSNVSQLDAPVKGDGSTPLAEFIAYRGSNPEQIMDLHDLQHQANLLKRALEEISKEYSERNVEIFRLCCGLAGQRPLQQAEVARKSAISRERVRQLAAKILKMIMDRTGMDETEIHETVDFLINIAPELSVAA